MRRILTIVVLLGLAGCSEGDADPFFAVRENPIIIPEWTPGLLAGCDRDYYVPAYGVGFDLPERASGFEIQEVSLGSFAARWFDDGFIVATLFSRVTVFDLETDAELQIALRKSGILVASGPITLNSGQRGWAIHYIDSDLPNDIFTVKTIVIGEELTHTYTVIGFSLLGTNDFDYLLDIARTLCAA